MSKLIHKTDTVWSPFPAKLDISPPMPSIQLLRNGTAEIIDWQQQLCGKFDIGVADPSGQPRHLGFGDKTNILTRWRRRDYKKPTALNFVQEELKQIFWRHWPVRSEYLTASESAQSANHHIIFCGPLSAKSASSICKFLCCIKMKSCSLEYLLHNGGLHRDTRENRRYDADARSTAYITNGLPGKCSWLILNNSPIMP